MILNTLRCACNEFSAKAEHFEDVSHFAWWLSRCDLRAHHPHCWKYKQVEQRALREIAIDEARTWAEDPPVPTEARA